jgi:hypothetical protein
MVYFSVSQTVFRLTLGFREVTSKVQRENSVKWHNNFFYNAFSATDIKLTVYMAPFFFKSHYTGLAK